MSVYNDYIIIVNLLTDTPKTGSDARRAWRDSNETNDQYHL